MFKNDKSKYIILIILVVVGILVVATTISVKENRKLNFFEKAIKDSTTFVTGSIYKPIGLIKEKIKENNEKNKIYKKYKKLKERIDKTEIYEARIKELEGEIDNLKKSLDINQTITDYKKINASVVNRNVGAWYNSVNINKGSKAGIKEGYAVITDKGLIGKVVNVSNFTSTVKLLSTDEAINKISVKIEVDDKNIYGLLSSYNKKSNTYLVEGISDNTEIKNGSKVVTTGLTDAFPAGILIGEVKSVTKDRYELAKAVLVTPSVDFENLDIVTVLDRESK